MHSRSVDDAGWEQLAMWLAGSEQWAATACSAVLEHPGLHGPRSSTELRSALPEIGGTYDPAPGNGTQGPERYRGLALKRRAAELMSWLDGVRIKPRFPSPLSKSVGI